MRFLRWVWLLTGAVVTRLVPPVWKRWHTMAHHETPSSLNPSVGALCQLTLHSRVGCHVLQDMRAAACGNLVPVPLETRGRVSHLDENPFSWWCTTEATISFLKMAKKKKKKFLETTELVCISPLLGPLYVVGIFWTWSYMTPVTHPYQGMLPSIPVENNRKDWIFICFT